MLPFFLKSCYHLNNIWNSTAIQKKSYDEIQPDTSGILANWVTSMTDLHNQLHPFISTDITPRTFRTLHFFTEASPHHWKCSVTLPNQSTMPDGRQSNSFSFKGKKELLHNLSLTFCAACVWVTPGTLPPAGCNIRAPMAGPQRVIVFCHSSLTVPIWQINFETKQKKQNVSIKNNLHNYWIGKWLINWWNSHAL